MHFRKTAYCVTPERRYKSGRIMNALFRGHADNDKQLVMGQPPWPTQFCVWGQTYMAAPMIARALNDMVPFWQIDNGFWCSAKGTANPGGYYSITRNHLSPTFAVRPDQRRVAETGSGRALAPWRPGGGKHVLVALPGQGYGRALGMDMATWSAAIVSEVRRVTDRPIIVREKGSPVPLEAHLRDCHVLVTHSSKVAVDAVIHGVPCIVAPTSPAVPVCSTSLSDIETPVRPDREEWWAQLMMQQYTLDEMQQGVAYRYMETIKEQLTCVPA